MVDRNTPITEISGIGEKTAEKLRKKISTRGDRVMGDLTVGDVESRRGQTFAQNVLASNQQKALSEATTSFTPDRESREKIAKKQSQQRTRTESDTIRRGDFTVQKEAVRTARDKFEDLPEDKRSEDKSEREPIVTNVDLWSENINQFDFPGVDTPRSRRVRAEPSDSVLNGTNSQTRPRENWRESRPEQTETQQRLGEQPDKADAERTGIYRAGDGEFVERPLQPAGDGRFVSPNGQVVTQPLQDPTIGRDPDDGEFEDMPLSTEPSVPLPDTGDAMGTSGVVGDLVQGGNQQNTQEFDRRATVGITPKTLGDGGFKIETESDVLSKQLGTGKGLIERADEEVGLPDPSETDSTDVVAEAEVGFIDKDSGFGYDSEVVETRESDDNIFSFR